VPNCHVERLQYSEKVETKAGVPAGMARKVITFSRDAKIKTADSTFSGELQTSLFIVFAKQKRKLCHYTAFPVF